MIEESGIGKGERVLAKASLYPRFEYGDELQVNCKLKKPDGMYYARQGAFLFCERPDITKIGEKKAIFNGQNFGAKAYCCRGVNRLWHEPQASFMAGLLYGYRGAWVT